MPSEEIVSTFRETWEEQIELELNFDPMDDMDKEGFYSILRVLTVKKTRL